MKSLQTRNRTPQARSVETRAAILAAAADAFAQSGLAGARTDTIAAAAGVNKAMLYYYFKSKSRLYEAVVEDHFEEFNRRALEVLAAPGSRAVLLRYVGLHFDFITSRQRYARIYQQMMMQGGRALERLVRKYFLPRSQALDRVLDRGMRAGEFRRADRRHTAISLVALIVFYFSASQVVQLLDQSDAYSRDSLKKRRREVLDFIRHGLFLNPDASTP